MKHRILLFALTMYAATCCAQNGTGIWDAHQLGFDTAVQKAVAAAIQTDAVQTVILPMGYTYTTNGVDTTTYDPSGTYAGGACVNIEGYQTSEIPGLKHTILYTGPAGGTAIKHTNLRTTGGCSWSNIIVDCNHLCATAFDSSGMFRFYATNLVALNCTGDCVVAGQAPTGDAEQFWTHLETGQSTSGTQGAGSYALVVNTTDSRFYDVRTFAGSTCGAYINHGANVFYDFHPQPGASAVNCGFEDHGGNDYYGLECDTMLQYCGKFYGYNSHVIGGRALWNSSYSSTGALLWFFNDPTKAGNNTIRSFSCQSSPNGGMQYLYNVNGTDGPTSSGSGLPGGTTVEQLNSCTNIYTMTWTPTIYGKTQNVY